MKEQLAATVNMEHLHLAELYPADSARALVPPVDNPQLSFPTWQCTLTGNPPSQGPARLELAEPAKPATSSLLPFEPTAMPAVPTHLPLLCQQHVDAVDSEVKEKWGKLLRDLAGIQGFCSGGYKEGGWQKPQ